MVYCLTTRFHLGRLDLKRWLSNGQPTSKVNFGPCLNICNSNQSQTNIFIHFYNKNTIIFKKGFKKISSNIAVCLRYTFVCLIIFWHLAALNISDVHVYAFWKLQTCTHLMGSMQFIVAIYFLACVKYGWFPMDWHVQLAIALQLQRNEKSCYLRGQTPDWLILKVSWWTLYSREV